MNFQNKPLQVGYKKIARLETTFIFKVKSCKADIKNTEIKK